MGMEAKSHGGNTSALTREDIRNIYRKVVAKDPQTKSRQKGRNYLQVQVTKFLSLVEHSEKFCRQIVNIIDQSIREVRDWDPEEAADAFLAIEKYALNVLDFPWKNEYKVVKLYTGFYCGRVSPQLCEAEELFKMMGYERLDSSRLVLKKVSSPDHLLYVACECYVAAVECILMTRTLERVEVVNYVLSDVYRCRQESVGDVDAGVLWITDNCTPSRTSGQRQKDGLDKPDRDRQDKERYSDIGYRLRERDHHWERFRDRLSPEPMYGLGYQNRNVSLGYTGYDSIGRPVRNNPGLSLHRKGTEDLGEISVEVPQNLHNGRFNRQSAIVNSSDIVYSEAGGELGDVADGGDPDLSSEISALTLAESVSDYDLYQAGTIDDHLQRSLLYIQRLESGPRSLREPPHMAEPQLEDEWGDVREKLRMEYGDKYFEGDRGNILKEKKAVPLGTVSDGPHAAPQFKSVEPETMQQYNSVVQEITGKISTRRVPTPSPPSSGTPRRSPPAYQSPPLSHHSPPQYVSPPQSGRPSPPQTRAAPLLQPCGLEAKPRMPSIFETIADTPTLMEVDSAPEGNFPPPPADLTPPDPRELSGADFEGDDDTLPPPPDSLEDLNAVGGYVEKGGQDSPMKSLALSGAQKEEEFDDARFDKPRFQSFGVEDGEFLLKRERGPSPPPRLLPRNGNGPYRAERIDRRSLYDNVDSDSNASTSISSPMGTASTFSSSADTVIAAQEKLSRQSPPGDKTGLKSDRLYGSNNSLLRKKGDAKDSILSNRKFGIKSQSYEEERLPSQVAAIQLTRPKSVGFAADDGSAAKWQCSTCTFKNLASHSVCDMCGRSREVGCENDPLTSGGPQCPYCTLVNPEGSKQCDACEADLEGCATYI